MVLDCIFSRSLPSFLQPAIAENVMLMSCITSKVDKNLYFSTKSLNVLYKRALNVFMHIQLDLNREIFFQILFISRLHI